ncbi:hypothetical protein ACOSQ3_027145 [Xanthoceras sorbifolium]
MWAIVYLYLGAASYDHLCGGCVALHGWRRGLDFSNLGYPCNYRQSLQNATNFVNGERLASRTVNRSAHWPYWKWACKPGPQWPMDFRFGLRRVVLVRHGQSMWNEEGRIQGSSDFSVLTKKGEAQAETSRQMRLDDSFDAYFSSCADTMATVHF